VNVVVELFPVELVGLTDPHAVPPQWTVQVTPAPLPSFATTAVRVAVASVATEVGGLEMLTVIADGVSPESLPHAAGQKTKTAMTKIATTPLHAFITHLHFGLPDL